MAQRRGEDHHHGDAARARPTHGRHRVGPRPLARRSDGVPLDVATGAWTSLAGLGAGVADHVTALVWVTGYAALALALAAIVRSVPLTLAIGIAWAGPFEHLLRDAREPSSRTFPGLLLEAFAAGGAAEVTAGAALVGVAAYATVAALVATASFTRRDVTV